MRSFIPTIVLAVLTWTGGAFLSTSMGASVQGKPNIILILADDMGFSDAGCYGGEIHTPSIDRLAAEGVRLTRFYNMARCCPTRASLLAGVYPHLCNLTISPGGPRAKRLVNFEASDRISRSTANWPCNRGFDDHWGTIPGVDDYYDPYGLVHNEQTFRPEGEGFYYTDFITDRSVEMVDRFAEGERPFFLYIAYTAPHW